METLPNIVDSLQQDAPSPSRTQCLHIVLVARNVARTIEPYLRRVSAYCQTLAPSDHRITVIDCESTDRTLALAELVARDLPNMTVKYSPSSELFATLGALEVLEKDVVVYADLARQPDPIILQDGIHAVSELDWDLVATVENPTDHKNWRTAAHRLKNSLHPSQRDDISFLTLRGPLFKVATATVQQQKDKNPALSSAQIFAAAQMAKQASQKVRCQVRQAVATTREHPLASLNAALTVSVATGLLTLTVFTQVFTTV